ncbi:nose resistant to fluoxetine protein 6-like isoform X2 [Episyrphus balteatus]|nr:nose resistant to fluoxetine protein 6-like isoform X2 [Episyrphus balteatus]
MTTLPFGKLVKNIYPQLSEVEKLSIGICIPRSCEAFEVNEILTRTLSRIFNVSNVSDIVTQGKCIQNSKLKFDTIDWIAISIFSFVGFLILFSTIYDVYSKRRGSDPNEGLVAFSLYVNMTILFRTSSKKSPNVISCLNGIRCMSIIWIIYGHDYMFNLLLPNANSKDIVEWAQTPFSMFLQSGTICVDSFFFLSGLLLIWAGLKEMERSKGKLNVLQMYLHRYIRLTPIVAAAILFYVSLFRHMGNGPLWNDFTSPNKLCHETWWATLLYVQNYAAAGKMCLGHTWYLAVDMQLYILSPLILIPIFKWKKKAIAGVIVLGLLLIACIFTSIVVNNYSVFSKTGNLGEDTVEMRKIYYATHARTSPWLIGIIFGYFLYNHRDSRIKMPKLVVFGGWIIAMALLLTGIFSLYPKVLPSAEPLTTIEGAFYLTLSRVAWPLALSWIVFACVNGYGGVANTFLSWPFWQPLARLSYSMYIIHLMVETITAGRTKVNVHFSDYDVILRFWGDFGITILVSIVAYLMFESPMLGIEKVLFKTKPKEQVKTISKEGLCDHES